MITLNFKGNMTHSQVAYINLNIYQNIRLFFWKKLIVSGLVNATTFNESIVFSGIGATKNNFLIDLYLKQEEEVNFLSSKYSSNQIVFKKIIDSLVVEKKASWIKMDSINDLSPIAQKVTQAAYIYPYASIRERYALLRSSKLTEAKIVCFLVIVNF